jgi:hypothetical protein
MKRAYEAGREHYLAVGWREAPLSGEHAGESMGELSTQYGVDLSVDEQADAFEAGYWEEYHLEREDWDPDEGEGVYYDEDVRYE